MEIFDSDKPKPKESDQIEFKSEATVEVVRKETKKEDERKEDESKA